MEEARELWIRTRLASEDWISNPDVSRWRQEFTGICRRFEPWVAVRGERIVGFLAIGRNYIDQLHVDPNEWRQGVGTALLRHAMELNSEGLACFTNELNERSRRGLEKMGFRVVGETVQFGECHLHYHWSPAPAA